MTCAQSRCSDRNKTFKPQKGHKKGTRRYDLHKFAQTTLGSGDMSVTVSLPAGTDRNEWLAVNTVDFFNEISLLYGTIVEFCTAEACPTMSAGDKFEYLWMDGTKITKPVRCSAPQYVDYLMTWVEEQLNNEDIFPTTEDVPFPDHFVPSVKTIFKRLFRVYAHMYFSHFDTIVSLKVEAHLNTCFKHFIYFVREFELVESKELAPLHDLIETLWRKDARKAAAAAAASSASAAAAAAAATPAPAAAAPPASSGTGTGAGGTGVASATAGVAGLSVSGSAVGAGEGPEEDASETVHL